MPFIFVSDNFELHLALPFGQNQSLHTFLDLRSQGSFKQVFFNRVIESQSSMHRMTVVNKRRRCLPAQLYSNTERGSNAVLMAVLT